MKINKYLKELGLEWYDLPGNYDGKLHNCGIYELEDSAAADPRNKENEEGFCSREFWNLDYTLSLFIYPRLCYFRENCADTGTPSYFCYDEEGNEINNANEKWLETIDKMILAFRYLIVMPHWETREELEKIEEIIDEGLTLFLKFYSCLWY